MIDTDDEEIAIAQYDAGFCLADGILFVVEALMVASMSEAVHDAYVSNMRSKGVESRISSLTGEETMVPWSELSKEVKEQDSVSVRAMLSVLPDNVRRKLVVGWMKHRSQWIAQGGARDGD